MGLVLAGLLLVVEMVSLVLALRDLNNGAKVLLQATRTLGTSPDGWQSNSLDAASAQRALAQSPISAGRSRLRSDPLMTAATVVPGLSDQVKSLRDLADAADASSAVLGNYIEVARLFQAARGQQGPPGPRLIALLKGAARPLAQAGSRLGAAVAPLQADRERRLLPPIGDRVAEALQRLEPAARQASAAAAAARLAPPALGPGHLSTYLVLLSDPAELRGSCGFSGVVGSVTILDGAPKAFDLRPQDSYTPGLKQTFDAPYPLPRFFNYGTSAFGIGEAGWNPDFPSAARLSEQMFKSATGTTVDGTLCIDPYAISALLGVTGPIDVPGYGTFDQQNFFTKTNSIVHVARGPGSGKQAIPVIARVVLEKILGQPTANWPRLLTATQRQLAGRHLEVYMHQAEIAAAVASARADGAILSPPGDYLMVVDGNVTPSKSDYYVHKSLDIKAELPASGISRHQLTLRYKVPPAVDDLDRAINPFGGAYANYLRVFLPENVSRVSLTYREASGPGFGAMDTIQLVGAKKVVSGYFRVERGHEAIVQVDYDLPFDPSSRQFDLFVQKQPGTPNRPTTLELSYRGGTASRQNDLSTDAAFRANW